MLVTGFCLLPGPLPMLASSLELPRLLQETLGECGSKPAWGHSQVRVDLIHFRQRTNELSASTVRCGAGDKEQGKDSGGGCPLSSVL